MSSLRVAVLGCGSIGRRHLENARALGCEVVAYDPAPEVRTRLEMAGISRHDTLEAIWESRPDAVLVAAPSHRHIELARDAAERGLDLFIEKPLSHSLDGVEELVRTAAARGLVTMVGCNMRFHPGPATVRRLLTDGAIGGVLAIRLETGSYLPRWRPGQDFRESYSASAEWGGALLDCIHEVDLALWLGGDGHVVGAASLPASVLGLDTDGLNEIILRHDDGRVSSIHCNFIQRDYHRMCRVIGSEGTLVWDFNLGRVVRFGPDGEIAETIEQPAGWQLNQMYLDELTSFLDCVRDRRPTGNPIEAAAATLRVTLDARNRGRQA